VAYDPASRDVRSDLYSLGCTFYFLLTGRVPFPGGTALEKIVRHQVETPLPLNQQEPPLPVRVIAIVEKLMARSPDARFATPGALATALDKWLTEEDPPRPTTDAPATSTRRKASSSKVMRGLHWFLFCVTGVLGGLIPVLLLRQPWSQYGPETLVIRGEPATPATFIIERSGEAYPSLTAGVNAAVDGDTIVLHADGPLPTEPVMLGEKALTLRAAAGRRPCLQFASQPSAFQSLLSTDRSLTLEGIDLSPGAARCDEGAHLICTEGAALTLRDCHIEAPRLSTALLVRSAPCVHLRECHIQVAALALCVEVNSRPECAIVIANSTLETTRMGAAAVSIWGTEVAGLTPVRLTLSGNQFVADRILAFRDLNGAVEVLAEDNRFAYREALFTSGHLGKPVTWHGPVGE
jgi:hypothetical protein